MLAAVLSSCGAVVELQAPCLSDSVLEVVLDYIYTGVLTTTSGQQQYCSLLAAACHLEMDGLQDAIMHWQQTEANEGNITNEAKSVCYSISECPVSTVHSGSFIQESTRIPQRSPSKCSTPSSSSPCCRAVSVICHSSSNHPSRQASACSSSAPVSQSGSPDSGSIIDGVTTLHENEYDQQNLEDAYGTPDLEYNGSSDQDVQGESSMDQSDAVKKDYKCIKEDCFITESDEDMGKVLSHVTDSNAHCDSVQSDYNTRVDSVLQNRNYSKFNREKHTTDYSDYLPSKHQPVDCSDSQDTSLMTKKEPSVLSKEPRTVGPLPVEESFTENDPQFEDLCPKGEETEEHSYYCRSADDVAFSQHGKDSDKRDTVLTSKRLCADVCHTSSVQNAAGRRTSLDFEQISDTKIAEPHSTFTKTTDSSLSDPAYSVEGLSYCGHLDYHCLSQTDPGQPVHFSPDSSDWSSDEEEAGLVSGSWPANQVLLLDSSTKPAELLVPYIHRCEEEGKGVAFGQKHTNVTAIGDDDGELQDEAVLGADGKDRSRPRAEVLQKVGSWEVEEISSCTVAKNQNVPLTVCTSLTVPAYVPASMPSTLSPSMPTNVSDHLPTPGRPHHFQCSLCHRSFSQRGSLNRHTRSHLGVRPFPCPRCPMTFSRQYRVTEHMRVHERCALGDNYVKPPTSLI